MVPIFPEKYFEKIEKRLVGIYNPYASEPMDPRNPHYGEAGAIYGQVYYSDGATENAPTNKTKHMSDIKLSTSTMSPTELISTSKNHIALCAPAPPKEPPIPDMNLFGNSAVANAKGKAELLQLGGFTVTTATHTPAPGVSQLENLILNAGKMPGSLAAKCNPDASAKTYEWQTTTGDPVTGPYVTFKTTTAARVTITGLTSGTRVWVRVRAIGTKGIEGPWSDPAMKIVP
jgi:hypothetical protein